MALVSFFFLLYEFRSGILFDGIKIINNYNTIIPTLNNYKLITLKINVFLCYLQMTIIDYHPKKVS